MSRIRLRKKYIFRHKFSIGEKIVIIIILLFLAIIFSLRYISKSITPVFMNYAEVEARKFITAVINKAISETKIADNDELFYISTTNDEISTIDFNINAVNEVLTTISVKIQDSIKSMDNGEVIYIPGYDSNKLKKGIIYELPTGLIFKNNLLSNVGPKIPIKLSVRGSIISNIDTNVTNYGINNALIKVSINLKVQEQVVLPFTLKKIEVDTNVPVIMKLIRGNVPKYYAGSMVESTPIMTLPIDEE